MPDLEPRRATLRDVAAIAGVSYQTVSRVVNRSPRVAPATREKVLRAIRDLDYSPNPAAQLLNTGRSYLLQLVIFASVYGRSVSAMAQEAHKLGYTLAITELQEAASVADIHRALEVTARMADGLLLMLPYEELSETELAVLCNGRPFVVVGKRMGEAIPVVCFDQRHGIHQVVEYLLSLGHRHIGEITGGVAHPDAQARHEALLEALALHGLQPVASIQAEVSASGGFAAAEALLATGAWFTALVVATDRMALGAIRALRSQGLRVPEDISVVGFEDVRESAYFEPPLTTVREDFAALGRQCIDDLVALIEQPESRVHQHVLYPELVVRQSTHLSKSAQPVQGEL